MLSGINIQGKSHSRIVFLSWQTTHMNSMSKWNLQQLLKLLLSFWNEITGVSTSMPSSTANCFPVPGFWGKFKGRHTACHGTAAAGLSWRVEGPDIKYRLWKNHGLSESPRRGCALTTDMLHDKDVCPGMTPCSKMQRPGFRGLQSTITPKVLLWERMCM